MSLRQPVKWQSDDDNRDALGIIWTCLSVIVTCTWTILHLNIPGLEDGFWTNAFRKIKWMGVTIFLPDFVLAHGVIELKMALDDLDSMYRARSVLADAGWRVDFNPWLRRLHWVTLRLRQSPGREHMEKQQGQGRDPEAAQNQAETEIFKSSSRRPHQKFRENSNRIEKDAGETSRETTLEPWTLSHSYFGNMGGILRMGPGEEISVLTSYYLASRAKKGDITLLSSFKISKAAIDDKSKADILVRLLAIVQILVLLVSVLSRAILNLPITQLEIIATAFSVISIATYAVKVPKPKDVYEPMRLIGTQPLPQHSRDLDLGFSCFRDVILSRYMTFPTRVRNSNYRPDSLNLLMLLVAIGSAIFGGLHCMAWNFAFPSRVEKWLWRTSSLCCLVIPLLVLRASYMLDNKVRKCMKSRDDAKSELNDYYDLFEASGWIDQELWEDFARESIPEEDSRRWWADLRAALRSCLAPDTSIKKLLSIDEQRLRGPILLFEKQLSQLRPLNASAGGSLPSGSKFAHLCHLIRQIEEANAKYHKWTVRRHTIEVVVSLPCGLLYGTARAAIVVIAFACFRSSPRGIYVDTWAGVLPTVG